MRFEGAMKRLVWVAAILTAVGFLALGTKRLLDKRSSNDPPAAEVVRVGRRDVGPVVKATGVIKPMVGAEVRVGSSASGVVTRLCVRIGDNVKKGALLADVDSRELDARRDAAEAAVRLAKANLDYAQTDLHRKQELSNAGVIARSELDLAQQAHGVADQQYKQAQANLADAVTQLGYARIIAPIAGTVESVTTQEGETVASSFAAPTFVTLLDLSRLEVWAYVDETDIGRVRVGQKATFTVDTYGDDEFPGVVTAIYPQAQIRDNVVDYIAVIHFRPLPNHILRPEMTTTVTIAREQHRNVLSLPISAVHRDGGRQYVVVQNGPSTKRRWITTGLRDDSYWEILNGVPEGEEVLVGNPAKQ
jgi:macrolide-specific efflux system membrane fusion protein